MQGLYRCYLSQPLKPEIPAYVEWFRLSEEYIATWLVLAESPEEATTLALAAQARCYPIPAEPIESELLEDSYPSKCSQVVAQGRRLPANEG
jgi:hypothetical protein